MHEVYPQERWNLKDVLPTHKGPAFEKIQQELETNINTFLSHKKDLQPAITWETLHTIIKILETIELTAGNIGAYGSLWTSMNTNNQEARAFKDKIQTYLTQQENKLLFFNLWIKQLDEKNAQRLIQQAGPYAYFLERIRKAAPHTLSEKEEQLINIKDTTGTHALINLYDLITDNFTYPLTINKKTTTYTREQLTAFVHHPDANLRKQAYQTIQKKYETHQDVLGEIYKNVVGDWTSESIQLRNYPTSISPRHLNNDISNEAIQAMLNSCKKHVDLFKDYFTTKSKQLKLKTLSRYDLYAPVTAKNKTYTWKEGVTLVLDAYEQFSPELANHARKIFKAHHVDAVVQQGKRGGAFCYDISPAITPYVLLSYTGKERDVMTLAHELGHGVHDLLTHKHSCLMNHPPLILAETASIFGEMIITDKLLNETNDQQRQAILANKLDDFYASIQRQAYFVLYEQEAHEAIQQGATISELNSIYLKNLQEQFGKQAIPQDFQYEWLSIPHIYHTPFYCYAYSFGNLLTLALYQMYKEQGKSFVPAYLKFLSHGGSTTPKAIGKELNIDFEDPHFWNQGFATIKTMIQQFKKTR
ncbi:MAG: M3 family oligoendopeptidase [Nanoarchaeota archaeon]|nr:M3 family oligoendopeptidase [Nanoarchaeota archaeon]